MITVKKRSLFNYYIFLSIILRVFYLNTLLHLEIGVVHNKTTINLIFYNNDI